MKVPYDRRKISRRVPNNFYIDPRTLKVRKGVSNNHNPITGGITNTLVADLWTEVARARRARGDSPGAKQAFVNARLTRTTR